MNPKTRHGESRAPQKRPQVKVRTPPVQPTGASSYFDTQAVVTTWGFDTGDATEPYRAVIRFSGRRLGVRGRPAPTDQFVRDETIERVVPGSGLVAVTTRVSGINEGRWEISARMTEPAADGARRRGELRLQPVRWSWLRWRLVPAADRQTESRALAYAMLAVKPASIPGSWLTLVLLGVTLGLVVQQATLDGEGVSGGRALVVSLLAMAVGFVGARLWYLWLHRGTVRPSFSAGWCVQGFVAGFVIVAGFALPLADLPVGRFLDATTPGLLLGLGIGRLGCFFTGCCAGRMTDSHWGIRCSDQRVCARRIPVQLLESATALVVGAASLVALRELDWTASGALFVGGVAAFTFGRQFLLRLRLEGRRSDVAWRLTTLTAGAAAVAAAALVTSTLR